MVLMVGLQAVLLSRLLNKCAKQKGLSEPFAFHLSYKFEISEPEGWKRSRKTVKHYQDTVSASLAPSALKCKGSWED